MTDSLYVRARLSLAVAGRESADLSRGIVGDVSTPMAPGERIRKARRVRLMSLTLVDRAVLAELSEGAPWETVAAALGKDVAEVKRIYGPTWDAWCAGEFDDDADFGDFGVGLHGDTDLTGTADSLDAWHNRHRIADQTDDWYNAHKEPWDNPSPERPVSQVLVDGQAAPGDSQGV